MKNCVPIIEIQNLCVWSGKTTILRDISWTVEKRQNWVILGSNGSGKTSLLNALTAYLTPSRGTIQVLGQTYGKSNWRELRKHMGMVSSSLLHMIPPDESALQTILSGKDALLGLWGRSAAKDKTSAKKILKQIECEHLAERPWRFLSQGEKQCILIGRALMAQPQLLILDEPCAGLDPLARELFLHFLQNFATKRNAPSFVLVTHHVEEIIPLFTHVMILKQGKVLAAGAKKSVLKSSILSKAFNASIQIQKNRRRFQIQFCRLPHKIA
ncbi:MAG: ABC transporter ATP-binding protein [Verrucomicrobiota bacterium]